jgi:ribonuclease-3
MSNTEEQQGAEVKPHAVELSLGYTFVDRSWLTLALTHRSAQTMGEKSDYERLEFLGDAVLDLAVAHLLLEVYPEAREGDLSKMRAALVNTTSLADIARSFDIGRSIRLSKGEVASGGGDRPSILADVFEAIVGAMYRDQGFDSAFKVVSKLFHDRLRSVTPRDPKTELQEVVHTMSRPAPEYILEKVDGPEHAPVFVSVVKVGNEILGKGSGPTKKSSQQEAASEALARLQVERENV